MTFKLSLMKHKKQKNEGKIQKLQYVINKIL